MKQHDYSSWALDTLLVHSNKLNRSSNNSGKPTVDPISTSTTYLHSNLEMLDQAFSGISPSGEPAYVYARQGNPNAQALEQTLAQAEKGAGAVVFSSGMAAIHAAFLYQDSHLVQKYSLHKIYTVQQLACYARFSFLLGLRSCCTIFAAQI